MDLVYICRPGDNEELRYSIRSAVENIPHNNVWVVGGKPDWYGGSFFSVEDVGQKFDNIVNCTKAIPDIDGISSDFILMNDDFFFLKPIDSMPVYHGGSLDRKIEDYIRIGSSSYTSKLKLTYNWLVRGGIKDPVDYDIHVPMPMNKDKLRLSLPKAYFPRSGYGNINQIGGELLEKDVKIYRNNSSMSSRSYLVDQETSFISTEDDSFQRIYEEVLRDMFPNPSKYEVI